MLLHGDHLIQSNDCNCITHMFLSYYSPGTACLCNGCWAQHVWQSICKYYDKIPYLCFIGTSSNMKLQFLLPGLNNVFLFMILFYFTGKLLCTVTHSNQWISGPCNFGKHESLESLRNFFCCCFSLYALFFG